MNLQVDTDSAPESPTPLATLGDELFRRLLARRQVMLTGEIDDMLAASVCTQLLLLDAEDRDLPVILYVNSPGGSVDAGFAIYDTMQAIGAEVTTICVGLAASMGQFLLTGGSSGRRFATPHARILMHQPHGMVRGNATDIEIQAEQFEYLRRKTAELTAGHSGQSVERVLADADRDHWFTAIEAVEYGLVDEVVEQVPLA